MADDLAIEVNGVRHSVQASPDTPLLYVLQDELELHAPLYGCGQDQCGSCAVLLDGKKVASCVMPVGEARGKTVTTVEGLPKFWARQRGGAAPEPELHPLQRAWIDEQVPQCGYCQPGMLIGAAELLTSTPNPSEEEIRAAMDGHLCRCGTYQRVQTAIGKAAAETADPSEPPSPTGQWHEPSPEAYVVGGGRLTVGFRLAAGIGVLETAGAEGPPASNESPDAGQIDSWVVIHEDNTASILTGHQELGTGTATGLLMIAGEELDLDMSQLRFVSEDTSVTPDSFPSTTSEGICGNGPEVRAAAAAARQALLARASAELGVPVEGLTVSSGVVAGGGRSVTYGQLLGGKAFNTTIPRDYNLNQALMPGWNGSAGLVAGAPGTKPPSRYKLIGKRVPRIDIPPKVTGSYTYVHHVRLPGMLHGRVVLPPGQRSYGAGAPVLSVDESSIAHIPGARVVRRGDFVAVVAPGEWDAVRAAEQLAVTRAQPPPLPSDSDLPAHMRAQAGQAAVRRTVDTGDVDAALASVAHVVAREYFVPYNAHVPIGPACAVADVRPESAVIFSNAQWTRQLQKRVAVVLGLPPNSVRIRWVEGSGSFGGSPGRYEVGTAAAIMSQITGQPVRVQFTRRDEHGWDNYGMPQLMDVRAGADGDGTITALDYTLTSPPFPIETYTIEQLTGRPVGEPQAWDPSTDVTGSQYTIPNWRLESRTLPMVNSGYLKTDFLRSPIAVGAAFAVEQAIDELAYLAGMDPLEFRRQNVQTQDTHPQANFRWLGFYDVSEVVSNSERWLAVLDAVAKAAGWRPRVAASVLSDDEIVHGRGIALGGTGSGAYSVNYCAAAAEIEVNKQTGVITVRHIYTCQDYGLVINPDGVESQAQGMAVQAVSRLLKEEVLFDEAAVTSLDWGSYPILRFSEAPTVTHVIISRPDITPGPGSEELMPAVTAAVANAFFDATGVRMTRAPLKPERVRAALQAARSTLP
jgi:CO/xanthine dehydrogenase Mo-binding subunit/aerobic-type carbon monoxide dehydrogenase small subunit (CoxS/CutS family)